jgi:hypothetical protein
VRVTVDDTKRTSAADDVSALAGAAVKRLARNVIAVSAAAFLFRNLDIELPQNLLLPPGTAEGSDLLLNYNILTFLHLENVRVAHHLRATLGFTGQQT